jgi:hypothetical protein
MKKHSRRTFLASSAVLTLGTATALPMKTDSTYLAHHVFFWLKNPDSKEDRAKLIEGLRTLSKIETVRSLHIGVPAETEKRPVVDSSYSVSELIFFDDLAGQSTYQDHPVHQAFVKSCSPLWNKVIVYDSVKAQ